MKCEAYGRKPITLSIWMLKNDHTIAVTVQIDNENPPVSRGRILGDGPMNITLYPRTPGFLGGTRRFYGCPTGRDQLFREITKIVDEGGPKLERLKEILRSVVMDGAMTAIGSYGEDCQPHLAQLTRDEIFSGLGLLGHYRLWWMIQNLYEVSILHHEFRLNREAAA